MSKFCTWHIQRRGVEVWKEALPGSVSLICQRATSQTDEGQDVRVLQVCLTLLKKEEGGLQVLYGGQSAASDLLSRGSVSVSCNFSVRVVLLTCGCCFVCFWVFLQFEAPVSDMQDNNTEQK